MSTVPNYRRAHELEEDSPERGQPPSTMSRRFPNVLRFATSWVLFLGAAYYVYLFLFKDGGGDPPRCTGRNCNMNGLYEIANKPKAAGNGVANNATTTTYNTDYGSKGHEYFDLYSQEIASKYGQVTWTNLPEMDLPAHIVERFKNSAIAITGYEHDQVFGKKSFLGL